MRNKEEGRVERQKGGRREVKSKEVEAIEKKREGGRYWKKRIGREEDKEKKKREGG